MPMVLQEKQVEGWTVLNVVGSIDNYTSPDFEAKLVPLARSGTPIVVDYSEAVFVSSAGLRVLMLAAKTVPPGAPKIIFCNLRPTLQRFFDVAGMQSIFKFVPTLQDAVVQPTT